MSQIERVPMTPEGFQKLKEELTHLKSVERPRLVQEIEDARAHGDLSENAEYHAAREKMGHIKGRMQDVESRLSMAEVIDPKTMKGEEKVMFGASVTLVDTEDNKKSSYMIVGEDESDIALGKISIKSPIARALIGKRVEDVVVVKTPKGSREFEIVEVVYK